MKLFAQLCSLMQVHSELKTAGQQFRRLQKLVSPSKKIHLKKNLPLYWSGRFFNVKPVN
jgi:hypothetical protein